ncbi:MAG TPA: cell envelope biogenesis protein TolA [Pseudolabrys sp.]|jgi:colicin import membrane protein|nr:cell envelope biogenesis protein TolA [Pseudolabrys sp.]
MRKATAISAGLHAAVLLWATLSFSGKTFNVTPAESLPVDFISEKDFSEMTKGVKDAPKLETPKPLVEKKSEEPPKPVEEVKPKVTEKKELQAAKEATPQPEPPPPKPDPIAEKLKQPEEPKQTKTEPQPLPPKKPPQKPQPKFEPDKIAALLDKRDPQRNAATGVEANATPSLGTAAGAAAQLSQSEIDALRARLMALWNPPVGMQDASQTQVTIRIRFRKDGTLAVGPQVLTSGSGAQFNAMRDSAVRAVFVGQPYTMLRPEHYEQWKEIDFTFDTRQMFHDVPAR